MAVSRQERMAAVTPRLESEFGDQVSERAIDVLTLTELAWHDCYGKTAPPADVVEDILVVAEGDLGRLVEAALLAVTDFRDLRLAADDKRQRSP